MTVQIAACVSAPVDEAACDLADWVELKTLTSNFASYNLNELVSLTEEHEDAESEDFSEQDAHGEDVRQQAIDEIDFREKVLKDAYPFELSESEFEIKLKGDLNIGQWVYLYCLCISHAEGDTVNEMEFSLSNNDRDLMQIAATFAAAGHFGEAVSFGFPRPSQTQGGFLPALRQTFSRMGEGVALNQIKPGFSPNVKDGEVDVIAWQPMNDGMPGKKFLLGQVATGLNWKGKSIRGAIRFFVDEYFSDSPKSDPVAAMFIPFCIPPEFRGSQRDVMLRLTKQFGIVYYRLRIPYYVHQAFGEERDFDRKNESGKFQNFVENLLGGQLPQAA